MPRSKDFRRTTGPSTTTTTTTTLLLLHRITESVYFIGIEHLELRDWHDRFEPFANRVHLLRDTFDEQPMRHEARVLIHIIDGHRRVSAVLLELKRRSAAWQREIELEFLHARIINANALDENAFLLDAL